MVKNADYIEGPEALEKFKRGMEVTLRKSKSSGKNKGWPVGRLVAAMR